MPEDFDEYECMDTILSRYNNIDYVINLRFFDGFKLIEKMNIKIAEDRLFEQWNIEHIYMDKNNYMSFEDYKNKAFKNTNTDTKSSKKITKEEALAEAERIRKLDNLNRNNQKGGD
ncbi:hypothetical protein [Clostridium arbusti]|uniref:hypothetical protein n=1 Tax=Clostridium arbusti TaxID=1137848 RepID=UPI0002FD6755|nr:hypothetical protein [Clostridium arbusti]